MVKGVTDKQIVTNNMTKKTATATEPLSTFLFDEGWYLKGNKHSSDTIKSTVSSLPPADKAELDKLQINGKIDISKQGNSGDCWLLSSLNALSGTDKGAAVIKKSISQEPNGNVTVTFRGINQSYTLTPKQINDAEKRLSKGDDDVRAIELAMEARRLNLRKKSEADSLDAVKTGKPVPQKVLPGTANDPMDFGTSGEAFFSLTRNPGELHQNCTLPELLPYMEQLKPVALCLNSIQNNPKRYSAVVDFYDDKKPMYAYHAYSVKSVGKDSLTIVNPWNSAKEVKLSRKEFMDNCCSLTLFDSKKIWKDSYK